VEDNMSKLRRAVRGDRDRLLVAGLMLAIAGCGGDGCAGCDLAPLPAGGLPADQTIEGGAQVRVAPSGFGKVEQIVGGIIDDALGGGICIPQGEEDLGIIGDLTFCFENQGDCTPGCEADITVDTVELTPEPGQLRIGAQFDVQSDLRVHLAIPIFPDIDCTLGVTANDTVVDALVGVGTDPTTGELTVSLIDIPGFEVDPDFSGCGIASAVINFLGGLFGDLISDFVLGALEPQLQTLIAELLPEPLGIENTLDLGGFLSTLSPGTTGALEARVVPGGYAFVEGGGLSVGILSGINTDRDPATRTPELDSEPAVCVPPMLAPDLAALGLPQSPRGNFVLPAAGAFRGQPEDPNSDVAIGVSQTFLDMAGHHVVTSGALCLGIGTQTIPQLTLGVIGIVVPSLGLLGEASDPLLLVTRPGGAIDFTVGDGTEESPSLTLHLQGFQIDFYAFLFQRYVRGFTVGLDLDVGVNLEFATDEEGNPQLVPVLVGLDAANIGVDVQNEEFLKEGSADLEGLLPSLLELALPFLTGALPEIDVPEILGFRLEGLRLSKVTTAEDDFLAIFATLGASQTLARLSEQFPGVAKVHQRMMAAAPAVPARAVARGKARLVRVTTPEPDEVRAHLRGAGGAMPQVVIDVPARDEQGRDLEWTWNLGGGLWRPFRTGSPLVIEERAFAMQGRYQIQLRSRVAGDYRTLSLEPEVVPVVIDSVPPRILVAKAAVADDTITVPAEDLVTPADKIQLAFGAADDDAPATAWGAGSVSAEQAGQLAAGSGSLRVWARDEVGNQSTALLDASGMVKLDATADGCACQAGGGHSASGLVLLVLAALVGLGRRRKMWQKIGRAGRAVAFVLAAGALASQPACSCGNNNDDDDSGATDADDGGDDDSSAPMCETNGDCTDACEPGTVPICDAEQQCQCDSDVQWGRIGQFSEMDVAPDGTVWVSAYNAYHGDLMIASRDEDGRIPDEAWQFVDGVPDGPVLVPGSDVRGGINEPGPDVGLYTDIAAAGDGAVVVTHFDKDTASLRFTSNRSGAWVTHVIDEGVPAPEKPEGATFEIAGQYSAVSFDADSRPGVAYFAHVQDGEGARTELRFAQAASADPAQAGDWTVSVIDSAAVPAPGADPLPIPIGVGLFVNAARLADGSPVVVYYDRVNGDLKSARFNAGAGTFDPPQVLDGADVDVGWYPGVTVDASDVLHVSYVSAANHDLLYMNTATGAVELVDDGYREVGQTDDGLPIPDFHFVGDDSSVVLDAAGLPVVAYQDATTHELLVARRDAAGAWTRETWAGDETEFAGGYGFYISADTADGEIVLSTWVIDLPTEEYWIEILRDAGEPPVD
jgi:MYXO-CTERM domain-containing protein